MYVCTSHQNEVLGKLQTAITSNSSSSSSGGSSGSISSSSSVTYTVARRVEDIPIEVRLHLHCRYICSCIHYYKYATTVHVRLPQIATPERRNLGTPRRERSTKSARKINRTKAFE